jgi:hypothetical protein
VLAINHDSLFCHQTHFQKPSENRLRCGQWPNSAETTNTIVLFCESCAKNSVNISLTFLSELIISAQNIDLVIRLAFTAHHTPTFTSWRGTSWINGTPVPIILRGNMSVQMKPHFIKKSKIRVNFTATNWLKKEVAGINPASQVT